MGVDNRCVDRQTCLSFDRQDPLAKLREEFAVPEGVIYLDGNSLGALTRQALPRLNDVIAQEWGKGLIRSWNAAHWMEAPARIGDKIARLIGAKPGEVIVADSTSVNLFKLLAGALRVQPGRHFILVRGLVHDLDRFQDAEQRRRLAPSARFRRCAIGTAERGNVRTGARFSPLP